MVKAAKIEKPTIHKTPSAIGHNGLDQETFHIHLGQILKAKAQVEAVKKILKTARRAAQDNGLNLADLDEAMSMRDMEPETVQETIRRKAQYAAWMGLAPGIQPDMFTVADAKEDDEKAAEQEGYIDGLEGVTAKGERFDTSNPLGRARLKGWNRGQDVLKERMVQMTADAKAKEKEKKMAKEKKTETKKEETEAMH